MRKVIRLADHLVSRAPATSEAAMPLIADDLQLRISGQLHEWLSKLSNLTEALMSLAEVVPDVSSRSGLQQQAQAIKLSISAARVKLAELHSLQVRI